MSITATVTNETINKTTEKKYTVSEAATFLHISKSSLWRLIWNQRIGYYKISGRTILGESHLENYLSEVEQFQR